MKKFAKIIPFVLITAMLTSNVPAVSVSVDGLKAPIETTVLNKNGYTLVGIRSLMNIINADVDWIESSRTVTVKKDDIKIEIPIDSITATINGKKVKMSVPATICDSSAYVPLRFISENLGYEVNWIEENQLIEIKTGEKGEYYYLKTDGVKDENTVVLTFDEAVEKARKKNSNLLNIDDSVEYLEETKDDLGNNLTQLDYAGEVYNNYLDNIPSGLDKYQEIQLAYQKNTETIITVLRNMKAINSQQSLESVNRQMINDSIDLTLKSYLSSIKSAQMNIQLLEKNIEVSEKNLKNSTLKNSLGMLSDYDLEKEQNTLKTNKANLESLKLDYQSKKEKLNLYLGLSADTDLYIEYEPSFEDLDGFDLEGYIIKKKEADPSITVLKKDVEIKDYNVRTSQAMLSESKIKVQNDLNTSQRALKDAQDNMEQNIRTCYNNLKTLKENDRKLRIELEKAISDYNTVTVSYRAGMAIETDVEMARLGILSAEKNIEDNKLTYDTLLFTFNKPYMLAKQ